MKRVTTVPCAASRRSARHKPFCSQGCRDRDLLNWLGDGYRVPGETADPDAPGNEDGLDSER